MAQLAILRNLALGRKNFVAPVFLHQQVNFSGSAGIRQQRQGDESIVKSSLQASGETANAEISTHVRPLREKIKENTKTASYTAIILAGLGVTGIMFYAIFRELFSSNSPNNIYARAFDRVKEDSRVQDALGMPIKGYGEESRRGRRRHVAYNAYDRNGVPHILMQFHIQGLRNKATVQLEMRKDGGGRMEYRYLFVQLDYYPRSVIILEDNREALAFNDRTPLDASILKEISFVAKD